MLSKLAVSKFPTTLLRQVRQIGKITSLDDYDRLRELCCTSELSKRAKERLETVRPKMPPPPEPEIEQDPEADKKLMYETLTIKGRNALILGGSTGIGYEAADLLLKNEAGMVIIGDISQSTGMTAVKKLCATYGSDRAMYLMTDLDQSSSIESAFKQIYQRFEEGLHIYINCVGIYNETPHCWDHMVRTNLIGCVRGMVTAYKYMKNNLEDECSQGSVIVNVSSYGSIANVPSMPMFSAASNGINGLTMSFGQDFHFCRTKIRCIAICPTCTDTGLHKNMDKYHYNRAWAPHSNSAIKCCTKQSPKIVGRAIVHTCKFGENGVVYVVKEGKFYRYAMPDYSKILRAETNLV